jgi:hypothetical protein
MLEVPMTDQEWLEEQELAIEQAQAAQERWLESCRCQGIVTQKQLEEMVEVVRYLEVWRARTLEKAQEIIAALEEELAWDEARLRAALEGGAVVEAGELTLEDALPGERQMKLEFEERKPKNAA